MFLILETVTNKIMKTDVLEPKCADIGIVCENDEDCCEYPDCYQNCDIGEKICIEFPPGCSYKK